MLDAEMLSSVSANPSYRLLLLQCKRIIRIDSCGVGNETRRSETVTHPCSWDYQAEGEKETFAVRLLL